MYKIKIILVIIFTFLFSTTSWGEWTLVTETEYDMKYYYDKDRVRKSGKYLYFWELFDYLKPSYGYFSNTAYVQLDCSIFRFKSLILQFYKNSMGEGEMRDVTPEDKWEYPLPDSVFESMYNKVCEEHQ